MNRPRLQGVLAAATIATLASGCTFLMRVSGDGNGGQGNGASNGPALSADGRFVAFSSLATNLVAGDTNTRADVFVRDNLTNTVERVSVASDGTEANGGSSAASISDDGRYVAFDSTATNLVASGGGPFADVFVHDRMTGDTTLVSPAGGMTPDISADGGHIAYVPVPLGAVAALFDREAGTTDTFGADASGTIASVSISDDANRVLITKSDGFDPASGLPIGRGRVYDRAAGTSTPLDGPTAYAAKISGDGHSVAYSAATATGPPNSPGPVAFSLRWEHLDGPESGMISTGSAFEAVAAISRDGNSIAFDTIAPRVPGDVNGKVDVYVWDRVAAQAVLVGTDAIGFPLPTSTAGQASFSGDGRYIAFSSQAEHVTTDTNGVGDIFVRAVVAPVPAAVTPASLARGTSETIVVTGAEFAPDATVTFGDPGIGVVATTWVSETELSVAVTVAADASTGAHDLRVTNPGIGPDVIATAIGVCTGCLTIS